MKAWEDLVKDPDTHLYWTDNSDYYIHNGVKIERFKNGEIEIKNVMGNTYKFHDVTPKQRFYFERFGWLAGCHKVCSDHFERLADQIGVQIKYQLAKPNPNKQTLTNYRKKRNEHMEIKFNHDKALQKQLELLSCEA